MVLCHSDFLPFMPDQWQNLALVDQSIIDEFSKDNKSYHVFMNWLQSLPTHLLRNFVDRHPTLCKRAVKMLPDEQKKTYYWITVRVNTFADRASGSNVFWIDTDRKALPPNWQPEKQEERLIKHITTNEKDFANLVKGLLAKENLFVLDYPRTALAAITMASNKDPKNQKIAEVQRRISSYVDKKNSSSFV